MHVAELSLCKELYELGGWMPEDGDWWFWDKDNQLDNDLVKREDYYKFSASYRESQTYCPAYSLGYLLRKLPRDVGTRYLQVFADSGSWLARYGEQKYGDNIQFWGRDEDVTNAVCRLAIELFKKGILTKEAL